VSCPVNDALLADGFTQAQIDADDAAAEAEQAEYWRGVTTRAQVRRLLEDGSPLEVTLSAAELAAMDVVLPVDGGAHARYLASGQGVPWSASRVPRD